MNRIAMCVCAAAAAFGAAADECKWIAGDGEWNEPTNWSGGFVPRAQKDTVKFENAAPIVVTCNDSGYANALEFAGADVVVSNTAGRWLYLDKPGKVSVAAGTTASIFRFVGTNKAEFEKTGAGTLTFLGQSDPGFASFKVSEGEVTLKTTADAFSPCGFVDVAAGAKVRLVNNNCVQNSVVFRLVDGAEFIAEGSDQLGAVTGTGGLCYALGTRWPVLNFSLDKTRGPYESSVTFSNLCVSLIGQKPEASAEDKALSAFTIQSDNFRFASLETRSGYSSEMLRFAAGARDFYVGCSRFLSADDMNLVDAMGEPIRLHTCWYGLSIAPLKGEGVVEICAMPECMKSYGNNMNNVRSDSFDTFEGEVWLNANPTITTVQNPTVENRLSGFTKVRKIKKQAGCTTITVNAPFATAPEMAKFDIPGVAVYASGNGGVVQYPAFWHWGLTSANPYSGTGCGFVISGDSHVEHTGNNWISGNSSFIRTEGNACAHFNGGVNMRYNGGYTGAHTLEIAGDSTFSVGDGGIWNLATAGDGQTRVRFLGGTLAYKGASNDGKDYNTTATIGVYPTHQVTVTNKPAKIKVDVPSRTAFRTIRYLLRPQVADGETDGGVEKSGFGDLRFGVDQTELRGPVSVKAGLLVSGSDAAGAPFGAGDVSLHGAGIAIDGGKGVAKTIAPNGAVTYSGASELRVVGTPTSGDAIVAGKADGETFKSAGAGAFLILRGENASAHVGADWTAKANGSVPANADGRVKAAVVSAAPTKTYPRGKFEFVSHDAAAGFAEFAPAAFADAGETSSAYVDAATTLDADKHVAALDLRDAEINLGGHKLTVGDGVNPALVLVSATADRNQFSNGTVDFGASCGYFLAAGADKNYRFYAKVSGTGGVTYGGIADSSVVCWLEQGANDYTGGTWIEGVRVKPRCKTPFGAEGAAVNVAGNDAWGGTLYFNDTSAIDVTRNYAWRFSGWGAYSGTTRYGAVDVETPGPITLRGTAEMVDEAMFRVTDGRLLTIAATVSGNGRMVKTGYGALALTADNSAWSGGMRVVEGEVKASSAAQLGAGKIYLESAGKLVFINDEDVTVTQLVYGLGEIQLLGKGKVTFTNAAGFKGKTFTAAGGIWEADGTGADAAYYAGSISGSGVSYVKRGDGVQVLAGQNTFGGATTVADGTLVLGGAAYAEDVADTAFCHLDASADGTVKFRDGTATDEVESWSDVDGRYTFKQTYDSAHADWEFPTFRKDDAGMNGLSTVFFTGYKNRLQATAAVPGFRTMVIAHRAQAGSHPKGWLCAGVYGLPGSDSGIRVTGGNNSVTWSPEHGYYYVNGAETVAVPCDTALVSVVVSPSTFCSNVRTILGDYWGHSTLNRCYWGDVGEVLFFANELNAAQRIALENALMEKWGAKEPAAEVTANVLPAGTDLEVRTGAKVLLAGVDQTVATISGGGEIANEGDDEVVLTVTGTESDFFGTLTGKIVLNLARGATLDLGGRTLTVWGAAGRGKVVNGTLVVTGEDRRLPPGTVIFIR